MSETILSIIRTHLTNIIYYHYQKRKNSKRVPVSFTKLHFTTLNQILKILKLIHCNIYTSSSQCQFNIGNLFWIVEINLTTRWHVIRADVRVGPGRRRSWLDQSPGTMWENQSGKRYMSGEQLLSVVPSVDETHILNCKLSVRHSPPDR